jgi:hypothetical protein
MPRKATKPESRPGNSIPYHLLLAAFELVRGQRDVSFDFGPLAVAAYKRNRKMMGLKGFEQEYLDTNALLSSLSGKRGLIQGKQWFWKAGKKRYVLSPTGIQVARDMLAKQREFDSKHPNVPEPSLVA